MNVETSPDYYWREAEDEPFSHVFDVGEAWKTLERAQQWLWEHLAEKRFKKPVAEGAQIRGNVHVGEDTEILPGTIIQGYPTPVYIGDDCSIGPNAYIRQGTLIGDDVEIGPTHVKRSVIRSGVKSHHRSYIGDSVIGKGTNIGTSFDSGNLKHTGNSVKIRTEDGSIDTGLRKLGVMMGDYCKTGCKTTTLPGTMMGPNVWTDAGVTVYGFIPGDSLVRRTERPYEVEPLKKEHRR